MEEVEEEPCVEVRMEGGGLMATPFFSQDNGTTLIRGGTVVNHDKAEVADVLVQGLLPNNCVVARRSIKVVVNKT